MESLEIILDKVCEELEEYAKKLKKDGKMSAGDLEMANKLIDIKKNILKTWKLEEEDGGYSQAGDWEAMGRMNGTYGRNYERGNSYANRGEHYVRGHYSRADGHDGNRGGYSRRDRMGRYSRDGGEDLLEHVNMMMEEAETPEERETIKRFKKELERIYR